MRALAGVSIQTNDGEGSGMTDNVLQWIQKILESGAYLTRLKYFHEHYGNVKWELRCRDALLEEFNKEFRSKGYKAYAELKKVDLVICNLATGHRFAVEFKYQYTFDMAKVVKRELRDDGFDIILRNARTPTKVRRHRTLTEQIVRDCDHDKKCHAFILIVQDRAGYPENGTLPGGVDANFVKQQRQLDRESKTLSEKEKKKAWFEPTQKLLEAIQTKIGGVQLPPIEHRVGHLPDPLTTHIFMLDMTKRGLAKAA
jgi:hypothetical protein